MVTVIRVNGIVSETWLYFVDLVIWFFQVFPTIDAAGLDEAEGFSQVVTDNLLNETFEIRQIQENLLKEVEPLVSKSKPYELSYVLSSINDSSRCIKWVNHTNVRIVVILLTNFLKM